MVILLGKALGLIIISGVIPVSVNGMSIFGHNIERTPFCPCLEENLSPITGLRSNLSLTNTFYAVLFVYPPVSKILSTQQGYDSLL
jgi:hypothetical protein